MKLATYTYKHATSCGIVTADGLIDIPSNTQGADKLHSLKEILIKDERAYAVLDRLLAADPPRVSPQSVIFKAPIPRPGKVLALAGNYAKHLRETGQQDGFDDPARTTNPWPFLMPSTAVTADGVEVPWPAYSDRVDYEVELAVFIGNVATRVSPEEAPAHIAGYTVANDISARRTTFADGRRDRPRDAYFDWLMGKWSNGFLPMGPVMVTAADVADPQHLAIEMAVNGQIRQQANTGEMIFDVCQIVSFLSHLMTLEPGDVIVTGTPHGVAAGGAEYLQPGDVMAATIESIGTLTNTLGDRPDTFYRGFLP